MEHDLKIEHNVTSAGKLKMPAVQTEKTLLRFPGWVVPNAGHMPLSCPRCGGTTFYVHVLPDLANGCGRVTEVVCSTEKCNKSTRVDDFAQLGGQITPGRVRSHMRQGS